MKTFSYSSGLAEQVIAEWASHACCNRFPPHFDYLIRHHFRRQASLSLTPHLLPLTHVSTQCMLQLSLHKRNLRPFGRNQLH